MQKIFSVTGCNLGLIDISTCFVPSLVWGLSVFSLVFSKWKAGHSDGDEVNDSASRG